MTNLERDIQNFIIKAVAAYRRDADSPMPDVILRDAITQRFQGITFTAGDLKSHIRTAEDLRFITGVSLPVDGQVWSLTADGQIRLNKL